jgi:hypothetical protein
MIPSSRWARVGRMRAHGPWPPSAPRRSALAFRASCRLQVGVAGGRRADIGLCRAALQQGPDPVSTTSSPVQPPQRPPASPACSIPAPWTASATRSGPCATCRPCPDPALTTWPRRRVQRS